MASNNSGMKTFNRPMHIYSDICSHINAHDCCLELLLILIHFVGEIHQGSTSTRSMPYQDTA